MTTATADFPGDPLAAERLAAVRASEGPDDDEAWRQAVLDQAESGSPARPHLRDRLITLDGLADLPPVRPLVDGLIYRDTIAQLSGAPGSYKSFVSIGITCAVAAGVPWEGHRVPEAGHVLYIAPEGSTGLRVRILAWCELTGVDPALVAKNLHVLREPLELGNAVDVLQAVEVAREHQVLLTVLDTRARCTTGLEENSSTEQGVAIKAAEQIHRASGGAVLGVHHTGRGGKHGRGSNAWDGAVWSDLQLEGADMRAKVTCAKHKDVPDGCEHHYRMVPHVVSDTLMPQLPEESGNDWLHRRSTLVAVQTEGWTFDVEQPGNDGRVLDIAKTSAGQEGLSRAQLVALATDQGISRAGAYAAVNRLVNKALLRNIASETRPKYVLTGPQLTTDEGW